MPSPTASPPDSARNGVTSADPSSASKRGRSGSKSAVGSAAMELPGHGHRLGQVITADRPQLHAGRSAHRQAADWSLGVAQAHRPVKSGLRFSMKAAIPSFWSSDAKSR